ncbi:MAG: hypothetical protein ACJAYE_000257 [Candidatus Azotimanducaceae bacterium]|jgi:hypothetical protein
MKNIILTFVLASAGYAQAAPDIERIRKDVTVMSSIIDGAFKTDESCDHCDPNIETSYLVDQGAVFMIRANSWKSFHLGTGGDGFSFVIPPSEPTEIRRIEIKEMVGDILDNVGVVMGEVGSQIELSLSNLEDEGSMLHIDSETRRSLRELNRERRELEYQRREHEIELIHADEEEQKRVEKSIEALAQNIAKLEGRQSTLSKTYEAEKKERQLARDIKRDEAKKRADARLALIEDIVLRSLCDYGGTLKNIPTDEYVSVIFEQKNASEQQVVVMQIDDITGCKDPKTLKSDSTSYLF